MMDALILLGGSVVLYIVLGLFMQWSERRDARSAVRETQAMLDKTSRHDSQPPGSV